MAWHKISGELRAIEKKSKRSNVRNNQFEYLRGIAGRIGEAGRSIAAINELRGPDVCLAE